MYIKLILGSLLEVKKKNHDQIVQFSFDVPKFSLSYTHAHVIRIIIFIH